MSLREYFSSTEQNQKRWPCRELRGHGFESECPTVYQGGGFRYEVGPVHHRRCAQAVSARQFGHSR